MDSGISGVGCRGWQLGNFSSVRLLLISWTEPCGATRSCLSKDFPAIPFPSSTDPKVTWDVCSLNHGMVSVGRHLKDHPISTPCHGQGQLPLSQFAPSIIQSRPFTLPGMGHPQLSGHCISASLPSFHLGSWKWFLGGNHPAKPR